MKIMHLLEHGLFGPGLFGPGRWGVLTLVLCGVALYALVLLIKALKKYLDNGAITAHKTKKINYTNNNVYNISAGIGFDRAAAIGKERAGGGVLIRNELYYKSEEGISVYRVDVVVNGQTEHKFEIDASSGYLIKYHTKYSY